MRMDLYPTAIYSTNTYNFDYLSQGDMNELLSIYLQSVKQYDINFQQTVYISILVIRPFEACFSHYVHHID